MIPELIREIDNVLPPYQLTARQGLLLDHLADQMNETKTAGDLLTRSANRRRHARMEGRPQLAVVGHGECGKDAVGQWFADCTSLRFAHGSSYQLIKLWQELFPEYSFDTVYAERRKHRGFWYLLCNALRRHDPARLVRYMQAESDVLIGIRAVRELEGAISEGLIDLTIWVDRPGGNDPTLELTPDHADIVIRNHGDLGELWAKLRRLANGLKVLNPNSSKRT